MPRPNPADVDRYPHHEGIPAKYQKVLYPHGLRYSAHANERYARRVEHLVPAELRPSQIKAKTMRLLASDVVDGKVVMQVWRTPLEGQQQDLVLAVSDQGKVATVWVVERSDPCGLRRRKRRPSVPGAVAREDDEQPGVDDAEEGAERPISLSETVISKTWPINVAGWRAACARVRRAIRNVLTHQRKKSCRKPPQSPL